MQLSAKERSKERQRLWADLNVWLQRERDLEVMPNLTVQQREEKLRFIKVEQDKLRRDIAKVNRGVRKQRTWSSGGYA